MVAKTAENQLLGSEQQQKIIGQSTSSMEELSLGVAEIANNNEEMLHATETMSNLVKPVRVLSAKCHHRCQPFI